MVYHLRCLFLFVALTACGEAAERVTANFQHSNAGRLGTRDAGLFEPGSLFLRDTASNEPSFLDVPDRAPLGGHTCVCNSTG